MSENMSYHAVKGVHPAHEAVGETKGPVFGGVQVRRTLTIDRPRNELFAFWRDFQNLPKFMTHLKLVRQINDKLSHWQAKAPAGKNVEWDATIIREIPNELISWRTTENTQIDSAGSISFYDAPGNRGTEVTVVLTYNSPGGVVGDWIAGLFGENPAQQISEDMRRFKALMETGEIPTSELRNKQPVAAEKGVTYESHLLVRKSGRPN